MPAPLGRLMTAMVTPFDANGEVDLEQTKVLAKALVASGTEGIVATGSTGEAASMDDDETIAVWRATKEAVGPDIAVIAGATSNNLRRSIKLTQAAEREGLDGVLLTVPAYVKPPQDGLVAHFQAIARSTGLPCVLYNVPSRAMIDAILDGRLPEAARMHHRMQTLVDVLFIESNPIPVKHALNCVGLRVGEPRLPLIPPSEGAAALIEAELQRHSIDIKGAIAEAATA